MSPPVPWGSPARVRPTSRGMPHSATQSRPSEGPLRETPTLQGTMSSAIDTRAQQAAQTSLPIDYNKRLMLFAGRANPQLAVDIAGKLEMDLGPVTLKTFSNGEVYCRYEERSEEHTSELQSLRHLVCRLLLEKK